MTKKQRNLKIKKQKKLRIVFLFSCFPVFLLAAISGSALAQSESKIGFVDLSRSFDEYQKTKDFLYGQ